MTRNSEIELLAAAAQAIVVDPGRPGLAAIAVAKSGPYDRASYSLANRLVGNEVGAAAIEYVLGPLQFRTQSAITLAVAGVVAPIRVHLGGRSRSHVSTETIPVPAGATVEVGMAESGLRGYLAIRGGLAVATVLGSRSFDTLSGLGPPPLAAGSRVQVGREVGPFPTFSGVVPHSRRSEQSPGDPSAGANAVVQILPGPRDAVLTESWSRICSRAWTVSPASDRVGMRLHGEPLLLRKTGTRASEPMVRGGVEVPPDGLPVILGPDHPTTGGYPVIGVVAEADQDQLGQLRPGARIRFRLADGGQAQRAVGP